MATIITAGRIRKRSYAPVWRKPAPAAARSWSTAKMTRWGPPFLCAGPARSGVRVVAAPHDVPGAGQVAGEDAGAVLEEGAVDLAVHVEARRLLQGALGPVAVLLPDVVHVLRHEREPADPALDR